MMESTSGGGGASNPNNNNNQTEKASENQRLQEWRQTLGDLCKELGALSRLKGQETEEITNRIAEIVKIMSTLPDDLANLKILPTQLSLRQLLTMVVTKYGCEAVSMATGAYGKLKPFMDENF